MNIWGYSELGMLLQKHPEVRNGIIIDTNILVSATYELDLFHEDALQFLELVIEADVPIFCNVNVRAEFLEIHRRIIFSEGLLDFESTCEKPLLPEKLSGLLSSYRAKFERRLKSNPNDPPVKLSEAELKEFKFLMTDILVKEKHLWAEFCDEKIGNKLEQVWIKTEKAVGLKFLSLRPDDREKHLNSKPEWENVVSLMSSQGISSSDAMILNMFFSSKFIVIASSDKDIAFSVSLEKTSDKMCLIPDKLKVSRSW